MSRRIKRFYHGNRILFVGARAELPRAIDGLLIKDSSLLRSRLRTFVDTSTELSDLIALVSDFSQSTRVDQSLEGNIDLVVMLLEQNRLVALEVTDNRNEPAYNPDQDGKAEPDLTEKMERVASYLPNHLEGDDWATALRDGLLNPTAIAMTLVFLAIAFSSGIGAAIVIGIGWALLGWGVFDFVRKFAAFVSAFLEADTEAEYNKCAAMLADAIKQFAVDAILALLTRGAGRAARRIQRGGIRGQSGSGSSNRARANESRSRQRQQQQQRRSDPDEPETGPDRRPEPSDDFQKPSGGGWRNAPNPDRWREKGGKIYEHADGSVTYENPGGTQVRYSTDGYPDFSPHATDSIELPDGFNGRSQDFREANALTGRSEYGSRSPPGSTWHHHENGTTMQLVPRDIHREFGHAGGISTSR